jgi:ribosomal protein S1
MNPELFKLLAQLVGVSLVSLVAGALLLTLYPNLKTLLGDVLRGLGWVAKWLRRASVGNQIEGTLSLFAKKYNGELTTPFLPECEVQWVTDQNVEAIWKSGKLILKVSFGEDHDKNFLAATASFVKTGLLPRAKSFLSRTTAEALNLLLTKTILSDSRRSALTIFNNSFRDISEFCRETYFKLEEIETKRLFRRVLLQEYFFFGEAVGESAPRAEHASEADAFLEWLFNLATREHDEASELAFRGEYIRVGVILVAREEIYRQYGIDAYLRRANTYASDGFQTIYLLSRGSRRSRATKEIAARLTTTGNFTELTDTPDLVIRSRDVQEVVTIIPLRPDLVGIAQSAWEKFKAIGHDEEVTVVVDDVSAGGVIVSALGLRAEIPLEDLSDLQISDARRYFRHFQELQVRLLEVDEEKSILRLSNRNSETDPKRFIDEVKEALEGGADAEITGYRDVDGYETGLLIKIADGKAHGFVPRSKATFSRFVVLSQKFGKGARIRVKVLEFQPRYNTFLCEVADKRDPWADIQKYAVGSSYSASLQQISERSLVYELEEGLEGVVFVEEVDWKPLEANLQTIRGKSLSEQATVQVLRINTEHRQIRLSLKRVQESPAQAYHRAHRGRVVEVEVVELLPRGVRVRIPADGIDGWIPVGELSWLYCSNPGLRLTGMQTATARIINYKPAYDSLILSLRQVLPNEFDQLRTRLSIGGELRATVLHQIGSCVEVNLSSQEGVTTAGYVHKSEVSNVAFLSDTDLPQFLPAGESFPVTVKRFDDRNRVVEVSRKQFLRGALKELKYGESYSVRIVQSDASSAVVCGERVEGRVIGAGRRRAGEKIEVFVARLSSEPREVELYSAT